MDFSKLKFDFSKISFETQLCKLQEEIGEVLKARKGEGDLHEEAADVIIAAYGLAKTLGIDPESAVISGIEKVNTRLHR